MGTSRYQKHRQTYVLARHSGILTACKIQRQTGPDAGSSPTLLAVRLPIRQPVGDLRQPLTSAPPQGALWPELAACVGQ